MHHSEYLAQRAKANESAKEELFGKAKAQENEDRECFSRYRDGWEVVGREDLANHPHSSLLPVYDDKTGNVLQQAYSIDAPTVDDAERNQRVFFLNKADRQALSGQLAVVPTLQEFRSTFMDIFCEGQLRYMNWDNVFAAGGGVLACAQPVPTQHTLDYGARRKYFHELQYSSSDVDLFLYGLDEAGAKKKLEEIYKAVCESNPTTVVCFRSAHAVTLVSQFPFRHIQIVLRLYSSPYEVLAGFDVDACTVGFDGKMVYCDFRAHHALVTRRNTIDVTRRSPSYEMRLAKYGVRGFEVEVNDLKREMVDPGIYERPWNSLDGLAKLLVLERLRTPEQRSRFFEMQKLNRGGGARGYHRGPRYDSLTQERIEEKLGGMAEVSNYSTVFLPWGKKLTAESTMTLMSKKDQKLNSPWFSRDRSYRLHPCFFGTAQEVLEDCSKDDPPFPPKKENEDAKMREHRETYVRGPLTFITDDPGRQRIGSFHPLSEVGWMEGVYFHSSTEELFAATNANDPVRVKSALEFCVQGPDSRDFFGRTALHLSLMAGALSATRALLEAGASPLEPMAGGRTVFHLAALYDLDEIVPTLRDYGEKTLLKNYTDDEAQKLASETGDQIDLVVGEADKESAAAKLTKRAKQTIKNTIRARDGDGKLSALQLALVLGNLTVAQALLKVGATLSADDEIAPVDGVVPPYQLVTLLPAQHLEEGIKLLVANGFSSSARLPTRFGGGTHFLDVVSQDDVLAAKMLLQHDPTADKALSQLDSQAQYPLQVAVNHQNLDMVELLLSTKKCPTSITEEMLQESRKSNEMAIPVPPSLFDSRSKKGDVPVIFEAIKTALVLLLDLHQKSALSFAALHSGAPNYTWIPRMLRTTIRQERLQRLRPKEAEDSVKICLLLAEHSELKLRNPFVLTDPSYIRLDFWISFETSFWTRNEPGLAPKAMTGISPREYAAFFIGKIIQENPLQRPTRFDVVEASVLAAASLELEAQLKSHPLLMSTLKGWRSLMQGRLVEPNSKDIYAGLDDATIQEVETRLKEMRTTCDALLMDLETKLQCPREVIDYARTTKRAVPAGLPALESEKQLIVQEGECPFPTTADLFPGPSNHDAERQVRDFLIAMETSKPVPIPFPSDIQKKTAISEPWIGAALQRSLFRMCARSFIPLDGQITAKQRHGDVVEFPRIVVPTSARALPNSVQEQCYSVFAQCYSGQVQNLEQVARDVPIASSNCEGVSPLTCAIFSSNPDMVREVIRLCAKQVVKAPKEKKSKAPARIDNFELMAEGDEAPDKEEEDEDEDDDEEDGDDDEANEKKKQKQEAIAAPGSSKIKPGQLFGLIANVYLEDSPLVKDVMKVAEELEIRHGHRFVARKINLHMALTPLQLAIVLNDAPITEALVEEAMKLNPILVRDIMLHAIANGSTRLSAWDLAISLDRSEILQSLLTKAGIGLKLEPLAVRLGVPTWQFKIESLQARLDAAAQMKKKGGRSRQKNHGLQSSLFGETKKKNEMTRDPKLARIDILPTPEVTFLHLAAQYGASKCYRLLMDGPMIQAACVAFVSSTRDPSQTKSIRELLKTVRERTPKAFSGMFSPISSNGNDEIQADAAIISYFLLGGADDTVPDRENRTPLHRAIASRSLVKLLQDGVQFSPKLLTRSYAQVSSLDAIRFALQKDPALGDFTSGGSPLSLACWLNDFESVEKLFDLGFNPNEPDSYTYGMNAFHLALHAKAWKCATLVAKRMSPSKLLEPNQFGITPLMTAARSGTVEGLLAAITACPDAKLDMVPKTISIKDDDGHTALHFAANARFAETLRTIMNWVVESGPDSSQWLAEDFTTGRTPLDDTINAVVAQELKASAARSKQEMQKRSREHLKEFHTAEQDESQRYLDFSIDGREVASILQRQAAAGLKRVRARFAQVRPAREKRLDLVGSSVDADLWDVRKSREDFAAVWSQDCQAPDSTQFLTSIDNPVVNGYLFATPSVEVLQLSVW